MEEASSQVGWRPECRADRDALGAGAAGARGKRQERIGDSEEGAHTGRSWEGSCLRKRAAADKHVGLDTKQH